MKRILHFTLLLAFTFAFKQGDPVLEKIVGNHLDAVGHKKIERLGMLKREGVYSLGGLEELKFVSYYYNGSIRVEYYYEEKGKPAVSVYTPDTAWKTTPWNTKDVVALSPYELTRLKEQAQITGIVANNEVLGNELSYDPAKNEDKNTQVITINKPDRVTKINVSIDAKTHLISKTEMLEWTGGAEQVTTTLYANYENVKGVKIPTKIRTLKNGKMIDAMRIEEMKAGLKYNSKLFKKP